MKKIYFLFFFLTFGLLKIKTQSVTETNITIQEGIYNLILSAKDKAVSFNREFSIKREELGSDNINFRIKRKKFENNTLSNYFTIQHMKTELFVGIKTEKDNITNFFMSKEIVENKTISFEFCFNEVEKNKYIIQHKSGCYLREKNEKLQCSFEPLDKYSNFNLFKLYCEVDKTNEEDLKILEKEPIDVLIKYIDLNDPLLNRTDIKQISKDIQNDELLFCIRSVLQNIPWIRKIFILMPNEKVRFLKDQQLIKDKIVFVKDKDLLGYESSNIHAFQFRLWNMKQFGMSDNFICLDDDYFIGKPLNKSDFFYVQNGTVVPAQIATKYQVHNKRTFSRDYNKVKRNIKNSRPQSSNNFMYTVYNTYLFFIDEFKGKIKVPYFTHNAIPINVKDLKEVYDLIHKSKFREPTLDSLYRNSDTLQFQTAVNIYTFNKYSRKVNLIKHSYIDAEYTIKGDYDAQLFCINTGGNKDYSKLSHLKAKISMNKIFPVHSKYEILNYTYIPYTSYQIIKFLDDNIKNLKTRKETSEIFKMQKKSNEKLDFINNFKSLSLKYKNDNKKILNEISKTKIIYDKCMNKSAKLVNELYIYYEQDRLNEIKKEKIIRKKKYENIKNETFKKLKNMEKNEFKLYFIMYTEFLIIIIFLIIILFLCFYEKKNNNQDIQKKNILLML
jgi:hypothetical protein